MIKKNKTQIIITSVITLLPILAGLFVWNYLPETMVTHWNIAGEADGFSSKAFSVIGLPVMLFAIHWLCILLTSFDARNKDQNSKIFHIVLWIIPLTSLIVCGCSLVVALGYDVSIDIAIRVLLGLMFVMIGNYMPKCKQNQTIGVRIKWTLRNEENWNKTHRFTGRLWVFAGVLLLATLFIPMQKIMVAFLVLILVISLVPMLYSYLYYRKQLKNGTATTEDVKMKPEEKKTTMVAVVISIVTLAFAGVLLFTGKYEVRFEETYFTIDATFWDDASVVYEDIQTVEYRDTDNAGMRTFGYGTPTLLMGEFENGEFGKYTRYSYPECASCIVLTVNDKILVLNGEDESSTKALYDEIMKRING